jgi:DNA-directed RNA polymerase I subunit RPA12
MPGTFSPLSQSEPSAGAGRVSELGQTFLRRPSPSFMLSQNFLKFLLFDFAKVLSRVSLQIMAAIGSLVFCTDCGSLLNETEGKANALLKCDICGAFNNDTSAKVIITESKPSAYPSALRAKRSDVQQLSESDIGQLPITEQPCEKCNRKMVRWYEQQLRGADEGSTIFYVCDCGNRFVDCLYTFTSHLTFLEVDSEQLIRSMSIR